MATITPALSISNNVPRVTWTGVSTTDTMTALAVEAQRGLAASVQFSGTWGSATVTLKGSNDNVTFFTLKDTYGNNISATADAQFELSTAVGYIKPASSGGTADNVDVVVVLRG